MHFFSVLSARTSASVSTFLHPDVLIKTNDAQVIGLTKTFFFLSGWTKKDREEGLVARKTQKPARLRLSSVVCSQASFNRRPHVIYPCHACHGHLLPHTHERPPEQLWRVTVATSVAVCLCPARWMNAVRDRFTANQQPRRRDVWRQPHCLLIHHKRRRLLHA